VIPTSLFPNKKSILVNCQLKLLLGRGKKFADVIQWNSFIIFCNKASGIADDILEPGKSSEKLFTAKCITRDTEETLRAQTVKPRLWGENLSRELFSAVPSSL